MRGKKVLKKSSKIYSDSPKVEIVFQMPFAKSILYPFECEITNFFNLALAKNSLNSFIVDLKKQT